MLDGARFLPASTTISRALLAVVSSSGALLAGPFEAVARPDSDAQFPSYGLATPLDSPHSGSTFGDPTALLLMQVRRGVCARHAQCMVAHWAVST
jgi:hypothetical protein